MTMSTFDPMCFGQYPVSEAPKVLHFQYEGSEDVFRYIVVDRIPISEISYFNRRKPGEPEDEERLRQMYLPKPAPKRKQKVRK